jgi:uncharacterized protein (UPF0548 family)
VLERWAKLLSSYLQRRLQSFPILAIEVSWCDQGRLSAGASFPMFLIAKPSDDKIRGFLASQAESQFSYSGVGFSADRSRVVGYTIDHNRWLLGYGEDVWSRAVKAINNWQMFNMGWLQLCWPDAPITKGTNVAVLIRHFGFWSLNAARVVYVLNERSGSVERRGFAYGTLLDHAESGEERFSVERESRDDSVWYDLLAFSRPRAISAKLAFPLTRWLQRRFRENSKAAMLKAVA